MPRTDDPFPDHDPAAPAPGSFRDPLSRVYLTEGRVFRGLSAEALADFEALAASSFYAEALERGDIVGTELVADAPATLRDWAAVLRHEPIAVVTHPYEWSFEMLRDAARLQLGLSRRALTDRLLTKDSSSYNIQFTGTKPVFIDVGSFERLRKNEPWIGYRQFCELFLNPLYIQALCDVPFQPLLRGSINGISPVAAAGLIGGRGRLQKGVLTHVRLHARAERKYADADRVRDVRGELKRAGFGPGLIEAQLRNLLKAVDGLEWKAQSSTWSEYTDRSHYTTEDLAAKDAFVARAVESVPARDLVLDLGANDGRFSRTALVAGAGYVVAVDGDDVVVDRLYRDLRREGEQRILPLVVDLSDPSPGLGWRSHERASFVDRIRPDLTLCLAVVHHLALTNNAPLDEVVGFLADFGAPLVVEFPHRDDPMASRLLARKRDGLFDSYDVANWEKALTERFRVLTQIVLPSGTRTLYRCDPR
jgi:hypothetical protein